MKEPTTCEPPKDLTAVTPWTGARGERVTTRVQRGRGGTTGFARHVTKARSMHDARERQSPVRCATAGLRLVHVRNWSPFPSARGGGGTCRKRAKGRDGFPVVRSKKPPSSHSRQRLRQYETVEGASSPLARASEFFHLTCNFFYPNARPTSVQVEWRCAWIF